MHLDVRLDGRCSRDAEAAAYFAIAEALTNAAKHSRGTECRVVVRRRDGGTLWARVEDNGIGGARVLPGGGLDGIVEPRARGRRPGPHRQPARRTDLRGGEHPVRILICEDSALLREGLVRLLEDSGHVVVAALPDASRLDETVAETAPELCILDVRLPPTWTDEGIRAALALRARARTCRCSSSRSTSRSATRPT